MFGFEPFMALSNDSCEFEEGEVTPCETNTSAADPTPQQVEKTIPQIEESL